MMNKREKNQLVVSDIRERIHQIEKDLAAKIIKGVDGPNNTIDITGQDYKDVGALEALKHALWPFS